MVPKFANLPKNLSIPENKNASRNKLNILLCYGVLKEKNIFNLIAKINFFPAISGSFFSWFKFIIFKIT